MKSCFVVFTLNDKGQLVPYDSHPVFNGKACHDLNFMVASSGGGTVQRPLPNMCLKTGLREFTGQGEVLASIRDYLRENPKAEKPGQFYILPKFEY